MKKIFYIILFLITIIFFLFIFPKIENSQRVKINSNKEEKNDQYYVMYFVGDIMLDRGVLSVVKRNENDFTFPFQKSKEFLQKTDLLFGNLEGPISNKGLNQGSIYSFRFQPSSIKGLLYAGFDILSIANNHIWDWGRPALEDTIILLNESNIKTIGAGLDEVKANTPVVLSLGDNKLGFLAFADFGYPDHYFAKDNNSGLARFSFENTGNIISSFKKDNDIDIFIVSFHFGEEYQERSSLRQREISRYLIDNGVDIVIGHHPHVIQEIEMYKGGIIVYSLGNFVFDQNFSKETMEGMLLEAVVGEGKIVSIIPHYFKINDQFQPMLEYLTQP